MSESSPETWDVKLYEDGEEWETIRGVSDGQKIVFMAIAERTSGLTAQAIGYKDGERVEYQTAT